MILSWLKSLSPRSLIGRTALILLVPIIAIELAVSYVFIQRLYENVTLQMTASVVPSVRALLDQVDAAPDLSTGLAAAQPLAKTLEIALAPADPGGVASSRDWDDLSGQVIDRVLRDRLPVSGGIDLAGNSRRVRLALETAHGPVVMAFARDRASASNPHQLLVLMVVVSVVAVGVSFVFLKNQVRPIRLLADAAAAFGRGRVVPYVPSGALEVRSAGAAFLDMRNRIDRHIEQRTLLLSGVSHDLRTPLTRMKLQLGLMDDDQDVHDLRRDVDEMQAMLDTFLSYARLDATEGTEPVDPVALARDVVARAAQSGGDVTLAGEGPPAKVLLRPLAVERALANLIGNALRHGTRVRVTVATMERSVRFRVEDDGPGIPAERREEAVRPFARLDASRNQNRGGGVGLGLSIVTDIARQHGGALRLGESGDLGGLCADLVLSR